MILYCSLWPIIEKNCRWSFGSSKYLVETQAAGPSAEKVERFLSKNPEKQGLNLSFGGLTLRDM